MPIEILHSKANYILFDYVLSYSQKQAIYNFICIAYKSKKVSTSNISFLKDILRLNEANAWKEVIKVK